MFSKNCVRVWRKLRKLWALVFKSFWYMQKGYQKFLRKFFVSRCWKNCRGLFDIRKILDSDKFRWSKENGDIRILISKNFPWYQKISETLLGVLQNLVPSLRVKRRRLRKCYKILRQCVQSKGAPASYEIKKRNVTVIVGFSYIFVSTSAKNR